MTTFAAAGQHPLLANWEIWLAEQSMIIPTEARTLGERGTWLVCNDPFIASLYAAHRQGLFGPLGPRHESLYDEDMDEADTSDASRAMRRRLNRINAATWEGRELDAENARTRRELEEAADLAAFATGDGFAVRVDGDADSGRSRWRLTHRDRVRNPDGKPNTATMRDGFVLVNGRIAGIWVHPGVFAGSPETKAKPTFYPWTATDGTPNVIHKRGFALPGMLRGVTRLAPMIIMERQVSEGLISHAAAKRLQAIHAMVMEAQNPEEYKKAMANGTALGSEAWSVNGPLSVWVKPTGSAAIEFLTPEFKGEDLTAYLMICYKVQCAVLQMPVDVVLCQMGEASLSASRAGLDQFDRTCQTEQEDHIAAVTKPIDRVAVADEIAAGRLVVNAKDWSAIMAGQHQRPPKYSTDDLKMAQTMQELQKAGVSKTSALKRGGFNAQDESELIAAERQFDAAQSAGSSQMRDRAFVDRVHAASAAISASGTAGLAWPIVVAAGAADTAPGAFIAALSGPASTSGPGQPATPATAPAQPVSPATEDQQTAARSWWSRAIARISGHRIAA